LVGCQLSGRETRNIDIHTQIEVSKYVVGG